MPFGLGLLVGRFVGWLDGCPVDGLKKNGPASELAKLFCLSPSLPRQLTAPKTSPISQTAATCPAVFLRRQIVRSSRFYLVCISGLTLWANTRPWRHDHCSIPCGMTLRPHISSSTVDFSGQ